MDSSITYVDLSDVDSIDLTDEELLSSPPRPNFLKKNAAQLDAPPPPHLYNSIDAMDLHDDIDSVPSPILSSSELQQPKQSQPSMGALTNALNHTHQLKPEPVDDSSDFLESGEIYEDDDETTLTTLPGLSSLLTKEEKIVCMASVVTGGEVDETMTGSTVGEESTAMGVALSTAPMDADELSEHLAVTVTPTVDREETVAPPASGEMNNALSASEMEVEIVKKEIEMVEEGEVPAEEPEIPPAIETTSLTTQEPDVLEDFIAPENPVSQPVEAPSSVEPVSQELSSIIANEPRQVSSDTAQVSSDTAVEGTESRKRSLSPDNAQIQKETDESDMQTSHSKKHKPLQSQQLPQPTVKSLLQLYNEILDIIESPHRLLLDAIEVFDEIRFLNLDCPRDLCGLIVHHAGLPRRREPVVVYRVYKYLISLGPVSISELDGILLSLVHGKGTSQFEDVVQTLEAPSVVAGLQLSALWKAAVASESMSLMRCFSRHYQRVFKTSEHVDPSFVSLMLSTFLDRRSVAEVTDLSTSVTTQWNLSLSQILCKEELYTLVKFLVSNRSFESAFKLMKSLHDPSFVHTAALRLFQDCCTRPQHPIDEIFEWLLKHLTLGPKDEPILERYLTHITSSQRDLPKALLRFAQLVASGLSFTEPLIEALLSLSHDFNATKDFLIILEKVIQTQKTIYSGQFLSVVIDTALSLQEADDGDHGLAKSFYGFAKEKGVAVSKRVNELMENDGSANSGDNLDCAMDESPCVATRPAVNISTSATVPSPSSSIPSSTAVEDQSRQIDTPREHAVASPVSLPNSAINVPAILSVPNTIAMTISGPVSQMTSAPSSQPSPSAPQEEVRSVADLEDQIHTCMAGGHYDRAAVIIKEIQSTLTTATGDQDYDVQLYIRVMTNVTHSQDPTPLFDVYAAFRPHMTAPLAEMEFVTLLERYCEEDKLEDAEQLVRDVRRLQLQVDRTGIRHLMSSAETRVGQELPFSLILQLYQLAVEGSQFLVLPRDRFLKYGRLRCDIAWSYTTLRLTIIRYLHWIKTEFTVAEQARIPRLIKFSCPRRLVLRTRPPMEDSPTIISFLNDFLTTSFQPPLPIWKAFAKDSKIDIVITSEDIFAWLRETEDLTLLDFFPESRPSDWEDLTRFQVECTNEVVLSTESVEDHFRRKIYVNRFLKFQLAYLRNPPLPLGPPGLPESQHPSSRFPFEPPVPEPDNNTSTLFYDGFASAPRQPYPRYPRAPNRSWPAE